MLSLWMSAAASAVTATYCAEYEQDFADASTGEHGGAAWANAWGAQFAFVRSDTGATSTALAAWNGATPGCVTVSLATGSFTWTVKLNRVAVVDGNTIVVKTANGASYTTTLVSGHTPTSGHAPYEYQVSATNSVRIMTAAAYALRTENGGVTGETFEFRDDPTYTGALYDESSELIWIGVAGTDNLSTYKFAVVHELGHALSDAANGRQGFSEDYSINTSPCTSNGPHRMNSREYASGAAIEGFAHYYSAVVWNDVGAGATCDVQKHYEIDWNVDSDVADTEEDEVFRCDANPAPGLTPTISYLDYLGQKCSVPSVVNRGTEYDWLGAFWELQVSGGESFDEVLDLWVGALPHNWNATDTDTTAFPAERMSTSAVGVFGSSTEWDAIAAAHGIDG